MNIAIEQTEEYVNGQLKNKYGDAFLRGNNGKILRFRLIPPIYRHFGTCVGVARFVSRSAH